MILILFLLIIFLVIILGFLLGTEIYAGIIASPYLGTPRKKIIRALDLASLKPDEHFYDLGSGDGRSLIIAVKQYQAQAIGFELWYFLYLWSRISIFFSPLFQKRQSLLEKLL